MTAPILRRDGPRDALVNNHLEIMAVAATPPAYRPRGASTEVSS